MKDKNDVITKDHILYEERSGGAIGRSMLFAWHGTWPFAKLEIYDDYLKFKVWPLKVVIKINEIDSVELYENAFLVLGGTGIRINHHTNKLRFLLFWTSNTDKILSILKYKGIKTKNKNDYLI